MAHTQSIALGESIILLIAAIPGLSICGEKNSSSFDVVFPVYALSYVWLTGLSVEGADIVCPNGRSVS